MYTDNICSISHTLQKQWFSADLVHQDVSDAVDREAAGASTLHLGGPLALQQQGEEVGVCLQQVIQHGEHLGRTEGG